MIGLPSTPSSLRIENTKIIPHPLTTFHTPQHAASATASFYPNADFITEGHSSEKNQHQQQGHGDDQEPTAATTDVAGYDGKKCSISAEGLGMGQDIPRYMSRIFLGI